MSQEELDKMDLELIPGTTDQYRRKKRVTAKMQMEPPPIPVKRVLKPGETLVFRWIDKHVSLNKWYASEHWTKRNEAAAKWHKMFKDMLPKNCPHIDRYIIALEYNSRLDPGNTITMVKLCEDMLQKEKIIVNDTMEFCKGVYLIPKDDMKKKSYKITVKAV